MKKFKIVLLCSLLCVCFALIACGDNDSSDQIAEQLRIQEESNIDRDEKNRDTVRAAMVTSLAEESVYEEIVGNAPLEITFSAKDDVISFKYSKQATYKNFERSFKEIIEVPGKVTIRSQKYSGKKYVAEISEEGAVKVNIK